MQFPKLEGSLKNGILRETYVSNCIDKIENKSDSINLFEGVKPIDFDWGVMNAIGERLEAAHYTYKVVHDFGKPPKLIINIVERPIDFKISSIKDRNLEFFFN